MWGKSRFVIGSFDMCLYLHANFEQNKLISKKLSGGSALVEYRGVFRLCSGISDKQVPVLFNQNLREIDSSKENLEVQLYCAGSVGWQRTKWISANIRWHFWSFQRENSLLFIIYFSNAAAFRKSSSTRYSINEFFDFDHRKWLS